MATSKAPEPSKQSLWARRLIDRSNRARKGDPDFVIGVPPPKKGETDEFSKPRWLDKGTVFEQDMPTDIEDLMSIESGGGDIGRKIMYSSEVGIDKPQPYFPQMQMPADDYEPLPAARAQERAAGGMISDFYRNPNDPPQSKGHPTPLGYDPQLNIKHLDAPVPGQSLTDTPGNARWEHPPQYPKVEEALDVVWNNLTKKENVKSLVVMLNKGIPVEAVAKTVLFGGFTEGKWTVDSSMLMAKPVIAMIAAIGARAGLGDKMKMGMKKESKSEKTMKKLAFSDALENPPKQKPKISKEFKGFIEKRLF